MNHISILSSLPIAKPLFTSASFSSESHLVEFQCLLAVKWFSGRLSKTRTDGIPWGYSQLFVLANIDTSVGNRSRYRFFLTHPGNPEGLERYRAAELGKCTCHWIKTDIHQGESCSQLTDACKRHQVVNTLITKHFQTEMRQRGKEETTEGKCSPKKFQ